MCACVCCDICYRLYACRYCIYGLGGGVNKAVKEFPACSHVSSFERVEEKEVLSLLEGLNIN